MPVAVDASAIARVLGIAVNYVNLRQGSTLFLPMRIVVLAQGATAGSYPSTKFQVFSAGDAGDAVGYGTPAYHVVNQLLPANGDGVGTIPVTVYPLSDGPSSVAAAASITPAGTQTAAAQCYVSIANVLSQAYVASPSDSMPQLVAKMVTAINAIPAMPFIASAGTSPDKVVLTAKWKGTTANGLLVQVIADALGVTYTTVQPTGGLVDPTVDAALAQIGNVWETFIVNAVGGATSLNTIQTFGEGRWNPLDFKPFVSFYGNTAASEATATSGTASRQTDRINCQLTSPGSNDMPWVVAARQVARIAYVANNNPAMGYGAQQADGITPGPDSSQWNYTTRNAALLAGSSTTSVVDGVVQIEDVVTPWAPTNENPPAYRYVVSLVKIWNVVFNAYLEFAQPEWAAAPLIPDDQPTINPDARKPKNAVTRLASIFDGLGAQAIISDTKTAKASIVAVIDGQNPNRLDVTATFAVSGNTNVKAITFSWGFFFGGVSAAA